MTPPDDAEFADPELIRAGPASLSLEPDDIDLTEREIQAIELRKAGYTFQEIADAMNFGHRSSAMRAVQRGLDKWGSEGVDQLRMLELSRMDTLTKQVWPRLLGRPARVREDGTVLEPARPPDPSAVDQYLRISQRRARLLGLDAPSSLDLRLGMDNETQELGEEIVNAFEHFEQLLGTLADRRQGGGTGEAADDDPVLPSLSEPEAG